MDCRFDICDRHKSRSADSKDGLKQSEGRTHFRLKPSNSTSLFLQLWESFCSHCLCLEISSREIFSAAPKSQEKNGDNDTEPALL